MVAIRDKYIDYVATVKILRVQTNTNATKGGIKHKNM